MGWLTTIAFDLVVAAVAAAAAVVGPELAAGAAALKTAEGVLEATELIKAGAVMIGTAMTVGTAVASSHSSSDLDMTGYHDPFSTPSKIPRPDPLQGGEQTGQGNQTDGRVPENPNKPTETEVEYEDPRIPLAKPIQPGDYAGIQKTMYDPPTGNILGLKFHARTHRGSIHSNLRHVSSMLRRSGARVLSVKATSHSPVRPHGQVWDSAFRA